MMDVSGTDPRTRTGLFLWPWASHPAVAANASVNNHPIGAANSVASGMATNILNANHASNNVPMVMEDQLETFYQRLSYSGAHASHRSQNLHQHPSSHLLEGDETNQLERSRIMGNLHSSTMNDTHSHGPASSSPRLLSPQSRSSVQSSRTNTTSLNQATTADQQAAAIAAFASVAATCGNGSMHPQQQQQHNLHQNARQLHHGDMRGTLPNSQLTNHLCVTNSPSPSSHLNQSPTNGTKSIPTDAISTYNQFHSHQLKQFSNSSAAAAIAAAVAGDRMQFAAQVARHHHGEPSPPRLSTENPHNREHASSEPSADAYSTVHQYPFHQNNKSPQSDAGDSDQVGRHPFDFMCNNRFISGLRDKSAAASLLFRNASVMRNHLSPEPHTATNSEGVPSRALLMNAAALTARECALRTGNDGTHSGSGISPSQGQNNEVGMATPNTHGNGDEQITNNSNSYSQATKGYKCKICQQVCFSRHDLSTHNSATHKQDLRPYRCEQCGRQFTTSAYLSQHRRIHTGVKPYACRYCERRFTQLSHVQQHERIHTGEKPYRCTTCMKSFTQMSNLQSHQRQHMKGKPHRCEQCFMSFDSKDDLELHVQAKHSGNRYAKVLVCPICTKSYNSETYLAKHMDRHKEATNTGSMNGTNNQPASAVDDLFAASFSNHSMAMAAAALSRRTGVPTTLQDNSITGHVSDQLRQNPQQVAVAAMAAARCAVASAAGDRIPFFNQEQDRRDHKSIGNYPTGHDLFHHLPDSLHSSHTAHLLVAAQQAHTSFSKAPYNLFTEFCPQSTPVQMVQNPDRYASVEDTRVKSELSSQNQFSTQSGPPLSSPQPTYSPNTTEYEQQLLNLTRTQNILTHPTENFQSSSTKSSPTGDESYRKRLHNSDDQQQKVSQVVGAMLVQPPPPAHQQSSLGAKKDVLNFPEAYDRCITETNKTSSSDRAEFEADLTENSSQRPSYMMQPPSLSSSGSPNVLSGRYLKPDQIEITNNAERLTSDEFAANEDDLTEVGNDTLDFLIPSRKDESPIRNNEKEMNFIAGLQRVRSELNVDVMLNSDHTSADSPDSVLSTHSGKPIESVRIRRTISSSLLDSNNPLATPLIRANEESQVACSSNEITTYTSVSVSRQNDCSADSSPSLTDEVQNNVNRKMDIYTEGTDIDNPGFPNTPVNLNQPAVNEGRTVCNMTSIYRSTDDRGSSIYRTNLEDPIRSSWASRELISPQNCSLEKITNQKTNMDANIRSQASFNSKRMSCPSVPSSLDSRCNSKPDVTNIPFYIEHTWRQYTATGHPPSNHQQSSNRMRPVEQQLNDEHGDCLKRRRRQNYPQQNFSNYNSYSPNVDGYDYHPQDERHRNQEFGSNPSSHLSSTTTNRSPLPASSLAVTTVGSPQMTSTKPISPPKQICDYNLTNDSVGSASTSSTHHRNMDAVFGFNRFQY